MTNDRARRSMLLLVLCLLAPQTPETSSDYPDPREFERRVREALARDEEIQKDLFYKERRRDVKLSKFGGVTIGPLRTFEVYPSDTPGEEYKRLIEIDGRPLPPAELARRDAEHQRNLQREAERRRRETPRERAERQEKAEEEQRERKALLDDAVAVFGTKFVGRETIEGRQVLVAAITPRPDARVKTREGRWMKHFAGRVWVDAANYQVVKLEMDAFEDVTIGWGIVGRLHQGSSVRYHRRLFEGVWVPAELTYQASGRTLLFRTFEFSATTTYFDYRRR